MRTDLNSVIDEIRQARYHISEHVGHDPERLVDYYIQLQKQYGKRLLASSEPENKPGKSAA